MVVYDEIQFRACLAQTIAWCQNRVDSGDPENCLRSDLLGEVIRDHGKDPRALWLDSQIIADVLNARGPISASPLGKNINGRILLSAYQYTNHNGATQYETNGYYDEHDCPPWDSWICEIACLPGQNTTNQFGDLWPLNPRTLGRDGVKPVYRLLAAWVPDVFVPLVQRAVEIEAVGMIFWTTPRYYESGIAPRYSEILPQWLQKFDM